MQYNYVVYEYEAGTTYSYQVLSGDSTPPMMIFMHVFMTNFVRYALHTLAFPSKILDNMYCFWVLTSIPDPPS